MMNQRWHHSRKKCNGKEFKKEGPAPTGGWLKTTDPTSAGRNLTWNTRTGMQ